MWFTCNISLTFAKCQQAKNSQKIWIKSYDADDADDDEKRKYPNPEKKIIVHMGAVR